MPAVNVGGVVGAPVSPPAQAAKTIADMSVDAIRIRSPNIPGMVRLSLGHGRVAER